MDVATQDGFVHLTLDGKEYKLDLFAATLLASLLRRTANRANALQVQKERSVRQVR